LTDLWVALFAALAGYLIGSISFTRIIGKIVLPGEDLSETRITVKGYREKLASQAVCATSLRERKGSKVAILTSFLDMLKAFVPVLACRLVFPEGNYFLFAGMATVAGHNYPVYYRFRGGRGMSPLLGSLLVIDWLAIPATILPGLALGLLIFRDFRSSNLQFFAAMASVSLLSPWLWFRFSDWFYMAYAVAINLLFWTAILHEIKEWLKLRESGIIGVG
jgi:glycerol-3-phosphate acyltransferase PlsY